MDKIKIASTLQNKSNQKKSIHFSSSAVFLGILNPLIGIDTEISFLNHFLLKRNIKYVDARFVIHNMSGKVLKEIDCKIDAKQVYSFKISDHLEEAFLGSVYVIFKSNENLAVPFCAVMCAIKSPKSVCGVHTYGRRLEVNEIGTKIDLSRTIETGWIARDSKTVKSFSVVHGGDYELNLSLTLIVTNHKNKTLIFKNKYKLNKYANLMIVPQEIDPSIVEHLEDKKGHIKIKIDGLKGIFPRMLCGNFSIKKELSSLVDAEEIQFTHTNFDFSSVEQPDSSGKNGYFNQPSVPRGYGIIYPVETNKLIKIDEDPYINGSLHHINVEEISQININSEDENLPSRFVAATIGVWKNAKLESECSTGTFIEDYLKVPCHWHWGLLKPGFVDGDSVISILHNNFDDNKNLSRKLNLKIYNQAELLVDSDIEISGHTKILSKDLLPKRIPEDTLWYVLSGDKLEDLNIFSTLYPIKKSGFVEHAF